jgi:hypothetical protein
MPCCDDLTSTNCIDSGCEQTVTIEKFVPEIAMTVSCGNQGNSQATTKDCITGCGSCNCEDAGLCRCVPLNATVTLTLTAVKNDGSCTDEDFTVITSIGGNTIDTQTIPYGDPVVLDPVEIIFDTEGEYTIVVTATNCCTSCSTSHTIFVGSPIVLNRIDCGAYQFEDFSSYSVGTRFLIIVRRVDNKEVSRWVVSSIEDLPLMSIPDGIHIIEYNTIDGVGTILTTKKFVVYEFCNIYNCYQNILRNYLCDNCDCKNVTDVNAFRELANKFVTSAAAFFMSVDVQYGNSYGTLSYKESELGLLRNQDILYDGINRLCGACLEKIDTNGTTNCTTC